MAHILGRLGLSSRAFFLCAEHGSWAFLFHVFPLQALVWCSYPSHCLHYVDVPSSSGGHTQLFCLSLAGWLATFTLHIFACGMLTYHLCGMPFIVPMSLGPSLVSASYQRLILEGLSAITVAAAWALSSFGPIGLLRPCHLKSCHQLHWSPLFVILDCCRRWRSVLKLAFMHGKLSCWQGSSLTVHHGGSPKVMTQLHHKQISLVPAFH